MSQPALARMDADTFLEWRQDQPGRWELVNGWPVQAMAFATRRHDRVVVNLIISLGTRLRGGPCEAQTSDIAARMRNGNIRQPDVTVDCARGQPDDLTSTEPTVFFEVLSPSTRRIDFIRKTEEYKQIASLKHIVLIDPETREIWAWRRRTEDAWEAAEPGAEATQLVLDGIGVTLSISDIFLDV